MTRSEAQSRIDTAAENFADGNINVSEYIDQLNDVLGDAKRAGWSEQDMADLVRVVHQHHELMDEVIDANRNTKCN